jgi:hypothetical protein
MSAKDVLVKARALLAQPGAWTKGWFARTADGSDVEWDHPEATCWCASGAILKCGGSPGDGVHFRVYNELCGGQSMYRLHEINDMQDDVGPILRAFDRAIERCAA